MARRKTPRLTPWKPTPPDENWLMGPILERQVKHGRTTLARGSVYMNHDGGVVAPAKEVCPRNKPYLATASVVQRYHTGRKVVAVNDTLGESCHASPHSAKAWVTRKLQSVRRLPPVKKL